MTCNLARFRTARPGHTSRTMRWGRWLAGGLVLLVVAGALVFYVAFLPGTLATDYRDSARPEHAKAVDAMQRVYSSFVPRTFAEQSRATDRAKTQAQYIRAARRELVLERRALRPARASLRRSRTALDDVDEKALTDVPDPPAIGGSGKLADAEDLAARERRYMHDARAFLASYRRLVGYFDAALDDFERELTVLDRGMRAIPEHPTSPEAFAGPVDDVASRLERTTKPFRRRKPPPAMRVVHGRHSGGIEFIVRELRSLAGAVRARDLARVEAFDHELTSGARKYTRGGRKLLRLLITRSEYARSIESLRRLELKIEHGYDGL